jgi:hypothetical protein
MATTRFGQIFWGLLLVIVNFTINGFDVLPDGIGFVLVAVGSRGLEMLSPRFQTAATIAWIMAGLWLIHFILPRDAAVAFGIAYMAVECVLVWMLMDGVRQYASNGMRPDLAARATLCGRAYVVLHVILGFVSLGGISAREVTVVLVLAVFVVLFLILRVIYRVRHEVAEREGELAAERERDRELT